MKAECYTLHHLQEGYVGPFRAVPTQTTDTDLCAAALEDQILRYNEAFGNMPTAVLYNLVDRSWVHKMRFGEESTDLIRTNIQYWIEMPFLNDTWYVMGDRGFVLSEGA